MMRRKRSAAIDPSFSIGGAAKQFWTKNWKALCDTGELNQRSSIYFTMLCVYVAEFSEASKRLSSEGAVKSVKTISGDKMSRKNPALERRDNAAKMICELGAHFNLSGLDRLSTEHRRPLPKATSETVSSRDDRRRPVRLSSGGRGTDPEVSRLQALLDEVHCEYESESGI